MTVTTEQIAEQISESVRLSMHNAVAKAVDSVQRDAERFRFLQNLDPVEAQAFFWNWSGRRNRAKAIDRAIELSKQVTP